MSRRHFETEQFRICSNDLVDVVILFSIVLFMKNLVIYPNFTFLIGWLK